MKKNRFHASCLALAAKCKTFLLAPAFAVAMSLTLFPSSSWAQEENGFAKINVVEDFADNGFQWFRDAQLLCAGNQESSNAMTIGWGGIGTLWGRTAMTVYVAEKRYTKSFMDNSQYFTVMSFDFTQGKILDYMGRNSGRDGDKAKALGLHTAYTANGTPYYTEATMVIECRLMYAAPFDPKNFKDDVPQRMYSNFPAGVHTEYIGEVVGAWVKGSPTNATINSMMERRSIRKYKDTPVEHAKLEQIALCGINAPSGMNQQPWEIRVVEDYSFIQELTDIYKKTHAEEVNRDAGFKNMFRNAPNIICVATPKGRGQLDAGMLAENMMVAAQSLGLGTCCLGGPVRFLLSSPDAKPYLDRLGFSPDFELLYILAVGYPDEFPDAKPRDAAKVKYIK